jgi:hypothetical protein
MSETTTIHPKTKQLRLRTGGGFVNYTVSTAPPRECTPEEVPIIDLQAIDQPTQERAKIAEQVRVAAETSGFFYIKNHGISPDVIQRAHDEAIK